MRAGLLLAVPALALASDLGLIRLGVTFVAVPLARVVLATFPFAASSLVFVGWSDSCGEAGGDAGGVSSGILSRKPCSPKPSKVPDSYKL